DYYHFDGRSYALIGERTGKVYRIGQEVDVTVIGVDMDEHVVDFELARMKKSKGKLRNRKTNRKSYEPHTGSNSSLNGSGEVFGVLPESARSIGRMVEFCLKNNSHQTERKSTRLNSSHVSISYAVFCLKKKKNQY